jgi:uncharacterized protein DUF2334
MHYVIIRDDDTNALTPIDCLERLYRPFLQADLPVNLAVIPDVNVNASMADGQTEGFLRINRSVTNRVGVLESGESRSTSTVLLDRAEARGWEVKRSNRPISQNRELVRYLKDNPGYHVVQHGCHHDYFEFDCRSRAEIAARLDQGTQALMDAGFPRPQTFVAPHDKVSRAGLLEIQPRFNVLSTGWFELQRLPYSWWPGYLLKKVRHSPHWQVGRTLLLSHPGCLLSCHRNYSTMLGGIFHYLKTQRLTVLVTHWWEYFRENKPDEALISILHQTAGYLASHPDLKVISFADLINRRIPLN